MDTPAHPTTVFSYWNLLLGTEGLIILELRELIRGETTWIYKGNIRIYQETEEDKDKMKMDLMTCLMIVVGSLQLPHLQLHHHDQKQVQVQRPLPDG
ncbi:uncharacterized protein LOC119966852 [Scyliorhinus canicula]|uniref:uncharacterized protein LOC119966852 n=1 Tax=Scyliorhinus canicula TaxID=7830 RepID=UPI0018F61751|nr:uncharacterized protein LOC119966852 [Scyliorhinus canicula]